MASRVSMIAMLALALVCVKVKSATFDVTQYGAVGDGVRDDSQAFQRAWNDSCSEAPPAASSESSNTILIPAGKRFLLEPIRFIGPCKSSVHIEVLGDLVAPHWDPYRRHKKLSEWILFWKADGLVLEGSGSLQGRGSIWWSCGASCGTSMHPNTLALVACNGSRVGGIRFLDSPGKHFTVYGSRDVSVSRIRIRAPATSPNTDGFMVAMSKNVTLTNSAIGTGDDCVTVGTGSQDVYIHGVSCGPGHGISIGSLGGNHGLGQVENVRVTDCWIRGATNGARIKTWQGGNGYARDIIFRNINMSGVSNPIIISQFYCPEGHCSNETSAVKISNVSFVSIKGTSLTAVAIYLACSDSNPCTNILLQDVDLQYDTNGTGMTSNTAVIGSTDFPNDSFTNSSYCLNVRGNTRGNVSPSVPCLYNIGN